MRPRLSVVIPSRNGLKTLPRAVDSALAMPIEELEIIVVDDGSNDGTQAWLSARQALDDRLIYIRRERDHGVAQARNDGIAAARAPLTGFLDADDVWLPQAVAQRLAWHETNPDVVLSFADYLTLLPDSTLQPRYIGQCPRFHHFLRSQTGVVAGMVSLGRQGFSLLVRENPVCTSSVIARTSALRAVDGFDTSLPQVEDWDIWIRLTRDGNIAASIAIEVHHADLPRSLSHDVAQRIGCLCRVIRRHRAEVWRRSPAAALAANCTLAQAEAELAMHQNRNGRAVMFLAAAAAWQPSRQHAKDAAHALLVLAGLKPSLTVAVSPDQV